LNVEVNYLAVFVAAVVSMILGFAWYSPLILGKPWMKAKGFTSESLKKAQEKMGKMYALSFVVALITAYVLSHVRFDNGFLDVARVCDARAVDGGNFRGQKL
jgi:dipeptide/tripeptide permease